MTSPRVAVYDIDQADGVDYIAMEYVAGKTLDELIPREGDAAFTGIEVRSPGC